MSVYSHNIIADKNNISFGTSSGHLFEESYDLFTSLNKQFVSNYGSISYVPYSKNEFAKKVQKIAEDPLSPYCGNVINTNYVPLAIRIDVRTSFSTSTRDFFAANQKINSPEKINNIYPIAVRYISKSGVYFIERPPFKMNISFGGGSKPIHTSIWIPWSIFVLNPNAHLNAKLFFSNVPLSKMEDKYVPAYTPNIYPDGRICMSGSLNSMPTEVLEDIRHLYSYIYNEYMNGGWNNDLYPNVNAIISAKSTFLSNEEKYPMINKLLKVKAEDICAHNKNIRIRTAERYVLEDKNFYYRDRYEIFKSFFLCLSTFTLEETLAFYKEAIEYATSQNSEVYQFDQIVNCVEIEQRSGYSYVPHNVQSFYAKNDLTLNFENSGSTKTVFFILENYHQITNLLSEINRGTYGVPSAIINRIRPDVISEIHTLAESISNNEFLVYEYDLLNHSRSNTVLQKGKTTFENHGILYAHYRNMIIERYSTPLNVVSDNVLGMIENVN